MQDLFASKRILSVLTMLKRQISVIYIQVAMHKIVTTRDRSLPMQIDIHEEQLIRSALY